eukprot:TRINITY_DN5606_c0_g1_i1.p1 TRINITY_DN5606_c0_g1~~TRINITY_DN5606_c0_g1_i1.p1  ORF type:complete len:300 (-),score=112.85 TRINITY_DN5606_c0_g1_i1:137-1036(-)
MEKKYNTRSPAVKRLMREAAEMSIPTSDYFAAPLEDNLFEWHFTVRGPEDTEFQGGIYHGRIIVPAEYPMKPPDIIVLTPNGRFEVGKKICLSISGFHPETWQPSWSIRTALLAIIGFMPTPGQGTIGSLDYTPDERKALARRSVDWCCTQCGTASTLLLPPSQEKNEEQKVEMEEIVKSVAFKSEEEVAQLKKTSAPAEAASSAGAASEPAAASAAAPSASSTSSPSSSSTTAAPPRRRAVGNSNSLNNRGQANVESRGVQVYDVLIMLLVAAIAALLARRINLMQDSESGSNFPAQE